MACSRCFGVCAARVGVAVRCVRTRGSVFGRSLLRVVLRTVKSCCDINAHVYAPGYGFVYLAVAVYVVSIVHVVSMCISMFMALLKVTVIWLAVLVCTWCRRPSTGTWSTSGSMATAPAMRVVSDGASYGSRSARRCIRDAHCHVLRRMASPLQ